MRRALIHCLVVVGAAACAGAPPVPPAKVEQETRRFLDPFVSGHNVACDELLVELTGNFFANVGRPAVDSTLHRVTRFEDDGFTETRWVNLRGGVPGALTVTVGELDTFEGGKLVSGRVSTFTVLRRVRIRVLEGRQEWALRATAQGSVLALEAGAPRDLQEFSVVDGVLRSH